jgi:hypothetical protein
MNSLEIQAKTYLKASAGGPNFVALIQVTYRKEGLAGQVFIIVLVEEIFYT